MDEVLVRYGENASETATRLLAAADDLDYEPWIVRHQPDDGGFRVPEDVADKAGVEVVDEDKEAEVEQAEAADSAPKPQKLTPKQQSVKRAEELGVSTSGSKAQIDKRIKKAEAQASDDNQE